MTSRGTLLLVYFVCLMLLAATIGVAQLELGALARCSTCRSPA